jgi:hypothetical protein
MVPVENDITPGDEPRDDLGVRRLRVTPDFFEAAEAMRAVFDERFGRARPHGPESFTWDYWHVPGQYTYLRTFGDRYFPEPLTKSFLERLKAWGREALGCGAITPPWLSYYVEGCVQELHADVPHGPWAYVFSLTRWEGRGFRGGETELLRPELLDFWRGFDPDAGLETRHMVDRIPAEFNQLTVFDARIPHAVRAIHGMHDPMDSRVVLHGWFEYPELSASDDLDQRAYLSLKLASAGLARQMQEFETVTGLLTVRVGFGDDGRTSDVRVLSNTLLPRDGNSRRVLEALSRCRDVLGSLQVPGASSQSWATVPVRLPAHA